MNGETLCFSTFHHSSSIHVSLLKVSVRFSSIHVNFCKVYGLFLTAYRQRRLPLGPCTEVLTGDRTTLVVSDAVKNGPGFTFTGGQKGAAGGSQRQAAPRQLPGSGRQLPEVVK